MKEVGGGGKGGGESAESSARERARQREREMFEISSRKMIAYLRARYRAVMSDFA
jgi:hypothetical protein